MLKAEAEAEAEVEVEVEVEGRGELGYENGNDIKREAI